MLDQVLFIVDDEKYDQFVAALDAPATDTPRLKKLLERVPAWEKRKMVDLQARCSGPEHLSSEE